ncbi:MAG TPA: amidohydrolase family protein [Actinomycetota bacterium]
MSEKLLLRGGSVLTLGAKTANFARADVLLAGGTVAGIGAAVRARDAEVVDATDTIVMPGFVDTHRHAWSALLRNLGGTTAPEDVRAHYRPDDVYAGTLIALLGAAEAGITTVVDWSDVAHDDDLAAAALRAHADAGLRTVLVTETGEGARERVARLREAAGPLTTIALGTRADGRDDLDRAAADRELARELGLRLHVHAGAAAGPGVVAGLAAKGLLADDVTLVHHTGLDEADLDAIRSSGAAVSLAPSSEMTDGLGAPPIQQLIDRDLRPGLGVDHERWSPGDLFAQMRAAISMQHATVFDRKLAGKGALPRLLSTRDVIRWATVDGARVAGLDGVTGSLEVGRAADVVVLRTDRPNIFPINDPIGAVVWGMDTSNVDRVIVGGRDLVRDGALQTDVAHVRETAFAARDRVAGAAGLVVAGAGGGR